MPERDSKCNAKTYFYGALSNWGLTLILDIEGFELHHHFYLLYFYIRIQHFHLLEIIAHSSERMICVNRHDPPIGFKLNWTESKPDAAFAAQSMEGVTKRTFTWWSLSACRLDNTDTVWACALLKCFSHGNYAVHPVQPYTSILSTLITFIYLYLYTYTIHHYLYHQYIILINYIYSTGHPHHLLKIVLHHGTVHN